MPTATGKPKVGERVRLYSWQSRSQHIEGVVTRRVDGTLWSIEVLLDGEKRPRLYVDAYWMADKGILEVIG